MSDEPIVLGGRYRVERELGRGGMAKVFLGMDTVLGRAVAIKLLAPRFAEDDQFVQRFRREAQAAAQISHHNIVSVFDTGSDDGVHFIVMEYVEGRTLAEFLSGGGRIMSDRAIDIAMDVCRALEAAHTQGVIHRDIKPGNIMLNPRGEVKVTDFGIARMTATAETIAQTAAVLGTAAYLSPEQAQGQPVDARSDIYSLGCVLYEMVTGRPPFVGDSAVAVASKQVIEQPVPPSRLNGDISQDLDAVILRALAKNPANRYQSAEELRSDLERVRRGMPVEATPLLPAASSTQVIDRPAASTMVLGSPEPERRWWVPVLVVLLVIGGIGLGAWILTQSLLSNNDDPDTPVLVTVPTVIGERRADAEAILEEAGLVVAEDVLREEDPEQEPGTVVGQDPGAGDEVEAGTVVTLTVVSSPDAVAIPPVAGLEAAAAQLILEQAGFEDISAVEEVSADVEEGDVIRTEPPEGTEVTLDTPVTIFVSTGPDLIAVPEVRCLSFNAAQNRLDKAGLTPVQSTDTVAINTACPFGNKVASQDPAPGTEVAPGTVVTLFAGEEAVPTGPTGPTGTT